MIRLRLGLVGLGDAWQSLHAPALRTLADRFEVRAVCDQIGHHAERAAAQFSADVVDGYRALMCREDIDAVLVLSPRWFGALPILAACDSGKAVYCATGLDLDATEAQAVKRRIDEKGIAFMGEFPCRHAPATVRLKELMATHLGSPRLIFCHQRCRANSGYSDLSNCSSKQSTKRVLMELVDWCCYVVNARPTNVLGMVHHPDGNSGKEDYQMISLDFSKSQKPGTGPLVQISCGDYIPANWEEAVGYRPPAALQVSCQRGTAFLDMPSSLVWFDEAGRHQEWLDSDRPVGEQLLVQFHRSVTSLVRRVCDLEDAYRALCIVEKAWQSHHQGQRLEVE